MRGEYGLESRPDIWYYLWAEIFSLATDEEIEPDNEVSDENSQSNWRNLSEDNETGVDLKHLWKNIINDIVLCIIVPIDSKYGSGKYRRQGRQTFKKKKKKKLGAVCMSVPADLQS